MSAEIKKEIELEIAHVLFIDIVGYSKLLINEQRALLDTLNRIVRDTEQFRAAESAGKLIKIPTGDGMALVFYKSPETPVECALEISRAVKKHPELKLRMGVHSGPISGVVDVAGKANLTGAGLNMAHRVMSCGDAGHILLSKHVAEDLAEFEEWRPTFAMTGLSWVYLAIGGNADGLRLSRQAADLISIEKDAVDGPTFQIGLAQIEARAGAPAEAIKRLRRLLSIPAGRNVSVALLKIDPFWDPIRNRPDFQQLLSGPEQIGPNK